ncbi:MAG: DEAD/DEAH box helicase family protein [Gammaproteobacteria bacterium]|nr:DEAD/DEAH box helicase family protein [Gammaproteobacteria bacterium]
MSKIRNEVLVLKVSRNINPQVWDEGRYDAFVDTLCQGREYQKEAIFTALRFLAGGQYRDLRALARENFDGNSKLAEAYGSWEAMESRLQLPDLLSCSLDLATGTGKSYVLYGIAAILLAEGKVNRVLTLCPSNTIEHGLIGKFRELAADADLQEAMPENARHHPPNIINASQSITGGCICVENYHAILKHVKSSIRESLRGGTGKHTLVLNDEAHHVASATSELRKWKEFLLDDKFGFQRIVGVSGTCYVGNDYFTDVVSRYSLRQAIEERQVKDVEYISEEPKLRGSDEKWQLIHKLHKRRTNQIKRRVKGIRPLTIVVTKNIRSCEAAAEDLRAFLQEHEGISEKQADSKVLVVTSSPKHQRNLARLRTVDNPQSKVEWITSVSMLSEGWDAKNVFQIVPHEERAFDSKLLIAQVLGRGLRVPENWHGGQPVVTIFNHESWAPRIEHLVNEILEMEKRVSSVILPDSEFHFPLHHLNYEKDEASTSATVTDEYKLFERGYLEFPTLPAEERVQVGLLDTRGRSREEKLTIRHETFTAAEVAHAMHENLAALDRETAANPDPKKRTRYAARHREEVLLQVVLETVRRSRMNESEIPDEAKQKFLGALGALRRKESRRTTYRRAAKSLLILNTQDRQSDSCSAAELLRDKTVFYRNGCENFLPKEQRDFFRELTDKDGNYAGQALLIENDYRFKTPVNLAIADSQPERKFMRGLCERENAEPLDAWLKNTAMRFYAVEYAWSKPTTRPKGAPHIKRGMFSPDFFIKQDNCILVVEIKDDSEIANPSPENTKKHEFARRHFARLNHWLFEGIESPFYQFNMLTPQDYEVFFDKLRQRDMVYYNSRLDAAILEANKVKNPTPARFGELDIVRLVTDAHANDDLPRGKEGTVMLVYERSAGGYGYEVEFEDWDEDLPFTSRAFKESDLELVAKWAKK